MKQRTVYIPESVEDIENFISSLKDDETLCMTGVDIAYYERDSNDWDIINGFSYVLRIPKKNIIEINKVPLPLKDDEFVGFKEKEFLLTFKVKTANFSGVNCLRSDYDEIFSMWSE